MNSTTGSIKVAAVGAATAALMASGLGAAAAHVSVAPDSTSEGGYSQLTFKVPSESKTATTSKIAVDLPAATPFTSVRVKPVPGWNAEIVRGALPQPVTIDGATITEAPLSVTWTANNAESQLSIDQYQEFSLSVGRLPKSGTTVTLPVAQSYSDGSVRNWDDPVIEGQGEPKEPAPSFVTTAAHGRHGAAAPVPETAELSATAAVTPAAGDTLGIAGLGAGILGLALGTAALVRTRSPQKP
ncbi:YcnI family copper-binding membrane protein [Pseudarthrobacter siccitolerans]